jgi:predicted AAA+ superfamily ATPase
MPEAIARYAEKNDVVALQDVYSSLLRSYSEDVEKYAKNDTMKNVIRLLLKKGWIYSTEQITLGNFAESNYKAREMGEALRTLERTYLLELTYPITTYQLPMIQENRRKPKLFWLDMGLINYVANIQQEVMSSVNIMDAWRGKLAEQIVAQELLSNTTDADAHRDFWVRNKNNATSELDFVYVYQGQIIPVEVKAGHNSHLRSLQIFMDEAPTNIALRVWNQPMQIDELQTPKGKSFRLLSIPFYYVHLLNQILQMLDVA